MRLIYKSRFLQIPYLFKRGKINWSACGEGGKQGGEDGEGEGEVRKLRR